MIVEVNGHQIEHQTMAENLSFQGKFEDIQEVQPTVSVSEIHNERIVRPSYHKPKALVHSHSRIN